MSTICPPTSGATPPSLHHTTVGILVPCQLPGVVLLTVGHHSMLIVIGRKAKVKDRWTEVSTVELMDTTNGC